MREARDLHLSFDILSDPEENEKVKKQIDGFLEALTEDEYVKGRMVPISNN
ncbi:MAG: hypothetical protein ACFFBW_10490 [Promethearchaeota archaeon]